MEALMYVIQKFSDTYLLPAVTSTFIALIYFSYKWGRTNFKNNPLAIFHIFYFGNDNKHENSTLPSESNHLESVFQPAVASTPLTQFRNISLTSKMLPIKKELKLKTEIAKLHCNLMKNNNMYIYPIHIAWDKSEEIKDFVNLVKESEPTWDYFDMIHPLYNDQSFQNKSSFYKSLEGHISSNHCNMNADSTKNVLNAEIWKNNVNENSMKDDSNFEIFTNHKENRVLSTNYYRFYYDTENKNEDLVSFDTKNTILSAFNSGSEQIPKVFINENKKQSYSEDEFVSVELCTHHYSEKSLKNESPLVGFEKDILNRMHSEDYWEIV